MKHRLHKKLSVTCWNLSRATVHSTSFPWQTRPLDNNLLFWFTATVLWQNRHKCTETGRMPNKWKYQACRRLPCSSERSDLERRGRKTEPTVLNTHKVTSMSYERTVLEPLSSGTEFCCCTCYISSPFSSSPRGHCFHLNTHSPWLATQWQWSELRPNWSSANFKRWLSALHLVLTLHTGNALPWQQSSWRQ